MAEFERNIGESEQIGLHLVKDDEAQPMLLPQELPLHGPRVHELGYMAGGHQKLVEKAMLGRNGQLELSKKDMNDPKIVPLIHPIWKDELIKGNTLVLHNWGKMDVIHSKPKEVVLLENRK
jgi:hypothetical protein